MQAILVSEQNEEIIQESTESLNESNLRELIDSYGDSHNKALYFTPNISLDPAVNEGWATMPQEYLDENYTYDAEQIATTFVDLTPKRS